MPITMIYTPNVNPIITMVNSKKYLIFSTMKFIFFIGEILMFNCLMKLFEADDGVG